MNGRNRRTATNKSVYPVETRLWVKLRDTDDSSARLDPGGSAKAFPQRYRSISGEYVDSETAASHNGEFLIYDPFYQNFILPGEIVPVRLSQEAQRYEIDGSYGLWRDAVVATDPYEYGAGSIQPDGSGRVLLWTAGAVTDPAQYVTAWLNWLHGDEAVLDDTRIIIRWDISKRQWVIQSGDCEPTV